MAKRKKRKLRAKGGARNPNAVALGALGASKGGHTRASSLPKGRRVAIARMGAEAKHGGRGE